MGYSLCIPDVTTKHHPEPYALNYKSPKTRSPSYTPDLLESLVKFEPQFLESSRNILNSKP